MSIDYSCGSTLSNRLLDLKWKFACWSKLLHSHKPSTILLQVYTGTGESAPATVNGNSVAQLLVTACEVKGAKRIDARMSLVPFSDVDVYDSITGCSITIYNNYKPRSLTHYDHFLYTYLLLSQLITTSSMKYHFSIMKRVTMCLSLLSYNEIHYHTAEAETVVLAALSLCLLEAPWQYIDDVLFYNRSILIEYVSRSCARTLSQ